MKRLLPLLMLVVWMPSLFATDSLVIYGSRQRPLMEPLLLIYSELHGVDVRYVEEKSGNLLRRLTEEGERSGADLLLTADIGILQAARDQGLLQPNPSPLLRSLIPPQYRDPNGHWFGLSLRARMIVYAPDRIAPDSLQDYADLASPALKGRLCIRSLNHVYNQSLTAAMLARWGESQTRTWLRGMKDNLARPPQGGDRDQIRAVSEDYCDVALVNSYYFAMMQNSDDEREVVSKLAWVWPEDGVHVNISGGGVTRHAPHPQLAKDFLEFLAGFDSQRLFAVLNQEYPAVLGVPVSHTLMRLGAYEADFRPLALIARQRQKALMLIRQIAETKQ
ncbi:MAG: extracellular solute-binding protein [Candidatus Thiodiazotropha sp.]